MKLLRSRAASWEVLVCAPFDMWIRYGKRRISTTVESAGTVWWGGGVQLSGCPYQISKMVPSSWAHQDGLAFTQSNHGAGLIGPQATTRRRFCLSYTLVDLGGFEPPASSMPLRRAPNCATGPRLGRAGEPGSAWKQHSTGTTTRRRPQWH